MSFVHLAILLPFMMAILVPFLYRYLKRIHTGWLILPVPVLIFVYFLQFLGLKKPLQETIPWVPSLGINFSVVIDGLSMLFALLISGIGALVVLYSIYYLSKKHEDLRSFYIYLLLFMGAMLGVVLSDNLLVLYTFWELTSISSFLLIAYWHKRESSLYGAQKSMIITVFGGLSMLAGFLLLYNMTGTFSVREIIAQADIVTQHELFTAAVIFILLGAFTKSAQFPFYIWLPDAMAAPTPVSAYLHSATMVKAGIYLVARLTPVFAGTAEWFWLVSGFGLITLFWGSFQAVKQTDLKGILAFSTVSQLGLIMSLFGVGSASVLFDSIQDNLYVIATTAAIFHLINHATFKGSLFMVVGIVDHETGTRDIRKLGGLMALMPITFTVALIGAGSMAGLPPFNGFLSKEMFFTGMIRAAELNFFSMETWGLLFPFLAWLASIFTFIYSTILVLRTFTGKLKLSELPKKPHEAPIGMLLSPIILAVLVVLFGFVPNLLSYSIIKPALEAVLPSLLATGDTFKVKIYFWHGFTIELFMTIAVISLGILGYVTVKKWSKIYNVLPKNFTLNHVYNAGIVNIEKGAAMVMNRLMTGSLRQYLTYIFLFFITALGLALILLRPMAIDFINAGNIELFELVLAFVLIGAAITTIVTKSRLTAIISLGTVGYLVSLFFVLFRAPDLALTQLIVETISVALFLLCFRYLPNLQREAFKLNRLLISVGVGVVVTVMAISADATRLLEPISQYYVANTYEEAAGKNMVNVILVDFRGVDTLFEITVLGIAALGIFAMITLRVVRRDKVEGK
ncbi:Na+/H+ antiporter subunit A [Bacillus sp. HMF5848]|uniref:Na+/H+ antiporter subunit A n=1 Tax=Bacillus sp. HMF5848 TaxID=2495421 RepID=UPI000F79AE17|nr:Na+/H+ antiporter subunit A [Bacillus sp. HMF5848]RSK28589.1 Na+/H+ antiporter subunit A [Bacillus sp. HMF5848]